MDQDERVILTCRDVARLFRVESATVHRWIRLGKLKPSFRTPSNQPRFYQDDIDADRCWPKDGAAR